jgi:hypothetical protein
MSPFAIAAVLFGAVLVLAVVREVALGYPRPLLEASVLSKKQQALVAAAADALFPPGGPIPISGTEAGLVAYMDGYVRRSPPRFRALIGLLLTFVELAPWLFGPRRARFTRLAPAEREQALARLATSDVYFLRASFLSLRTMLSMGYLANAAVARALAAVPNRAPFERAEVVS